MRQKISALLLAAVLAVGSLPALAAGQVFPAVNTYPGYADVKEGDWYYSNAKLCYEIGLMTGTDRGFEPDKVLTVAEVSTIAARIREALTGNPIPPADGTGNWFQPYSDYLRSVNTSLTSILSRPGDATTRSEFLHLLYAVLPDDRDLLTPINAITALPDTADTVVLRFYNAGILVGTDGQGTFAGDRTLTRAECAAMVARLVEPELRQALTLPH